MVKKSCFFLLLFFCLNHSNGQKLNDTEEKVVLNFIQLINNHNIDSLKHQVQYPLHRKKPFNSILDTLDFVNEYKVLFDEVLEI